MKRQFAPLVLSLVTLCIVAGSSLAQWSQIPVPNIYQKISPYFLNQNTGFIYDVNANQPNLRRTTDGGSNWVALRFFDDQNISVQQIYFTDINRGYAATSLGVYETEDMGNSWRSIFNSQFTIVNSVYAFGGNVFEFDITGQGWGSLRMTSDEGKTWTTIKSTVNYQAFIGNRMKPYVFGNRDGSVFAEDIQGNNMFLLSSTDNGNTWVTQKMDIVNKTFTMGLFSFPHCNELLRTYIAPNDPSGGDVYLIVHSSDLGVHWDTVHSRVEIGAWIAGNNCVQYVPNASAFAPGKGFFRSTDHAQNWKFISSLPDFTEIDDVDFRNLSVVGGGAVVYAGSSPRASRGSLWKTTTGGDGTLSSKTFATQIGLSSSLSSGGIDTLRTMTCDSSWITLIHQNLSCNYAHLDSFSISGLDPGEFSANFIHHLACEGLADSLLIKITPISAGLRNIAIHERFINDEYEVIDTSAIIPMISKSRPNRLQLAYTFSSGNKDTVVAGICDTAQVRIFFKNLPCSFAHTQSITIDGLDPLEYQIKILRDPSSGQFTDTAVILVTPRTAGIRTITLHAHLITNDAEVSDTTFLLISECLAPAQAEFYLRQINLAALPADTLEIPVYINSVTPLTSMQPNLDSVILDYRINTDLLTPFSFKPSTNQILRFIFNQTKTGGTIDLKFAPAFIFTGETELGKLRCAVYVSDTVACDIHLAGNMISSGCLSILEGSNVSFTLSPQCNNTTLSGFMKFGKAYDILNITPNPAVNSAQIKLKNNGSNLHYELLDALGSTQKNGTTTSSQLQLNLSGLSAGNYYFRLSGEGNAPLTKKLVIIK